MMKKMFLFLSLLLTITVQGLACGKGMCPPISSTECALGSVQVESSLQYVISIYGAPDRIKETINPIRYGDGPHTSLDVYYGNTIKMWFDKDRNQKTHLIRITSTGNNGWKTPSGFTVGMSLSELPSYLHAKEGYNSYVSGAVHLCFEIKNGKIVKIDMYGPLC